MRKRIAPSSSYAAPSATSRLRLPSARRPCDRAGSHLTVPVEPEPAERAPGSARSPRTTSRRCRCSRSAAGTRRLRARAKSQLKRAVRTFPMCRRPVGDGAMRTRTGTKTSLDENRVTRLRYVTVLFGAHVSAAGGISKAIDRIEEIGGNASRSSPRARACGSRPQHSDEELERFRRAGGEARVKSRLLPRALPRQPREPRRRGPRRSRSTRSGRRWRPRAAIGADAVVFHVGSHLGYGFDEARRGRHPGTPRAPRADDGRALALPREHRRRGRHDRPLGRRARRALRRARRPPAPRRLHRLLPLVGLRRRRRRRRRRSTTRSRTSTRESASSGCACCT